MDKTTTIVFDDESLPVKILSGRKYLPNDLGNASAVHEAIEIKCFYDGESTLLINGKTISVKAGDIVIINPYEFHSTIDYESENSAKYHLIMISVDFFSGLKSPKTDIRNLLFEKGARFKNLIKNNYSLWQCLMNAVSAYEDADAPSRLAVFGHLAVFFSELFKSGFEISDKQTENDISRYYSTIEPAIRMIRDNYSRTRLTVDELAAACSISKYHFCHVFKSVTGCGAISYLNSYRLKIANNLLKSSDKSISEIAFLCGFEDVSYFSKLYKQKFSRTPKSDRR